MWKCIWLFQRLIAPQCLTLLWIFSDTHPSPFCTTPTPGMKTLQTAGVYYILFFYTATTRAISHWFPIHSLPSHLLGSQWCSLFEADLIPHICTSIFLKRSDYDCFDPFHKRKLRPQQPATLKREVIASRSSLQIFSRLTWEHYTPHTLANNNFPADLMNRKAQGRWLKNEIKMAPIFSLEVISWIT